MDIAGDFYARQAVVAFVYSLVYKIKGRRNV